MPKKLSGLVFLAVFAHTAFADEFVTLNDPAFVVTVFAENLISPGAIGVGFDGDLFVASGEDPGEAGTATIYRVDKDTGAAAPFATSGFTQRVHQFAYDPTGTFLGPPLMFISDVRRSTAPDHFRWIDSSGTVGLISSPGNLFVGIMVYAPASAAGNSLIIGHSPTQRVELLSNTGVRSPYSLAFPSGTFDHTIDVGVMSPPGSPFGDGFLFVTDGFNNPNSGVLRVSGAGLVTTLALNPPLNTPTGRAICLAPTGSAFGQDMFVVVPNDPLEEKIYRIKPTLETSLFLTMTLGDFIGGATFGIDGNLYVSDNTRNRVLKISPITDTDVDGDGDVDGVDFSVFASCFNKAGNPPRTIGCLPLQADRLDSDNDGDIDGVDFAVFAACFNKAGNLPRTLGCPEN